MRDEHIQIIREVFTRYPEFLLGVVEDIKSGICANFTFQKFPLKLFILNPDNQFLRAIFISIEPKIADRLKLPPHYIRLNSRTQTSVLCLLDQEQHVLSSYSLSELIDLYLYQANSLLNLSAQETKMEYLKEFEYYWKKSSPLISGAYVDADLYIPETSQASNLNCWYYEKKKRGKYVVFSENIELNSRNKPEGVFSKAVYIPIVYPKGITPPQTDVPWDARDLLDIVYNQYKDRISPESFKFLQKLQIKNYKIVVVFSFCLQNSVTMAVAGVLQFSNKTRKNFVEKIQEDFLSFTPIVSSQMDLKYLHERVGQECTEPPSILVLGCGSIGSYLIPELINMGIVRVGISDPDEFESGNAFRHYLGPRRHGQNKTEAMKFEIEYDNPLVHVEVVPNLIEMNDEQLLKAIENYQIIIVAVGGTDLQRKFNYRFSKLKSTSWFLYNWLDAEGKGAHILAMRYTQKGCYECLFHNHGVETSKCKLSLADGTERVISNGCGGSFSPYGNNVLIRNTSLAIAMLQGILKGSVSENTVVSIPNEFTSLESSMSISPIINCDFIDEGCEICGRI